MLARPSEMSGLGNRAAAAAGWRTLELADFLAHALDAMNGERHAALVLQRAADVRLQPPRAGNHFVERMHARHRSRQLREHRDAGEKRLAHLLQIERAGLDHAGNAEDDAAVGVQPMEDAVLAVLQGFREQSFEKLAA